VGPRPTKLASSEVGGPTNPLLYTAPLAGGIHGDAFKWSVGFLERRGRERFGPRFRIGERDHATIFSLLVYFLHQQREAEELGIDLRKGIMLSGPVGCGKTSLMTLMKLVAPPEYHYKIRSCRDVMFELADNGFEVISRYSRYSFASDGPTTYCFDDLGSESEMKIYGNSCNVMAEILQTRYELFISSRMITHVTTNLNADEIGQAYGTRVRSRIREMMNLIGFDAVTDKRV